MRFVEGIRNLDRKFEQLTNRQWRAANLLVEQRTLDVFHRDEMCAVSFANFIDVRDVWM